MGQPKKIEQGEAFKLDTVTCYGGSKDVLAQDIENAITLVMRWLQPSTVTNSNIEHSNIEHLALRLPISAKPHRGQHLYASWRFFTSSGLLQPYKGLRRYSLSHILCSGESMPIPNVSSPEFSTYLSRLTDPATSTCLDMPICRDSAVDIH